MHAWLLNIFRKPFMPFNMNSFDCIEKLISNDKKQATDILCIYTCT